VSFKDCVFSNADSCTAFLLNIIMTDVAYCMYPLATLGAQKRGLFIRSLDDQVQPALDKYHARGWTIDFEATDDSRNLYGIDIARSLGDRSTKTVFFPSTPIVSDSKFEPSANTWLLTFDSATREVCCIANPVQMTELDFSFVSFNAYGSEEYFYSMPRRAGSQTYVRSCKRYVLLSKLVGAGSGGLTFWIG
jgi:hypothetical protein